MPIRFYLAGRNFDPETLVDVSAAFVGVCDPLGLRAVDDAVTRLVAETIIELVESGVQSRDAMQRLALERFKPVD